MFLTAVNPPHHICAEIRKIQHILLQRKQLIPSYGFDVIIPLFYTTAEYKFYKRVIKINRKFSVSDFFTVQEHLFLKTDFGTCVTLENLKKKAEITLQNIPFPTFQGAYLGTLSGTIVPDIDIPVLHWNKSSVQIIKINCNSDKYNDFISSEVIKETAIRFHSKN